jgi:MoaA/NifB/PqqE/SkfB family radical SAM enzyme
MVNFLRRALYSTYLYYLAFPFFKIPFVSESSRKIYFKLFDKPKVVSFYITDRCDFNCEYCYESTNSKKKLKEKRNNDFNFDKLKVIIDFISQKNVRDIELLGGEPLLYPHFNDLLVYLARKRINITIFTNGFKLDDNLIKKVRFLQSKYDVFILFSIKFDSKNSYSKYTQREYSDLIRLLKKLQNNGLYYLTSIVLHKENFDKIDQLITESTKYGALANFQRYYPINKNIDLKLNITNQQYQFALKSIKLFYQNHEKYFMLPVMLRGNFCLCYYNYISIKLDGSVVLCPFLNSKKSIGNIFNEGIESTWSEYSKHINYSKKFTCPTCASSYNGANIADDYSHVANILLHSLIYNKINVHNFINKKF